MRALLRFFALVSLAGGFAAVVVDGTRSIAANSLVFMHLSDTLAWLTPQRYEVLEPSADKAHPLLLSPLLVHLFDVPTWVVFSILGLLLVYLGRPRAPRIGFSSRP